MQIKIATMERRTDDSAVIVAHWISSEELDGFSASQYGTESFRPDPTAPDFIPFEELTEADVIGWLEARWGQDRLDAMQAALNADIENKKNPPVISGVPW